MTLRLAPAPAMADFLERAALSVVSGPVESPSLDGSGPLRCGVDLGTATIVLAIVDEALEPVYCDAVPSQAVRASSSDIQPVRLLAVVIVTRR